MIQLNSDRVRQITQRNRKAELTEALQQNLTKKISELTVTPTLFIGIGGSGREVLIRVMSQLKRAGVVSFFEGLLIDTDELARSGKGGYEGLEDAQFAHTPCGPVATVLENYTKEPTIAERFDLGNQETRQAITRISRKKDDQAGQDRVRGAMAYLCNRESVEAKLERKISVTNGIFSRLNKFGNDGGQPNLQKRINVIVCFSAAGGTGSSMALDVVAQVAELTKGMPVNITPIVFMPSVFEGELAGSPGQIERSRANTYATLRDLDAFNLGFGETHRLKLGRDERHASPFPTGVFSNYLVIERTLSDGTDLRSATCCYDLAALFINCWCGSSLADRIAMQDANAKTLSEQCLDPDTNKPRNWGSLGATALTFNADRIAKLFTTQQMFEFVRTTLGKSPQEPRGLYENWLSQCLDGKSLLKPAEDLCSILTTRSRIDVSKIINPLFKRVTQHGRRYVSYGEFRQRVSDAMNDVKDHQLPKFEQSTKRAGSEVATTIARSIESRCEMLRTNDGLNAAIGFLNLLIPSLRQESSKLENEVQEEYRRAESARSSIFNQKPTCLARLFTRCCSKQDIVASLLKEAINAEARARYKDQARASLASACDVAHGLLGKYSVAKKNLVSHAQQAKLRAEQYQNGNRINAELLVELDVSTPELETKLFEQLRMDETELHHLIANCAENRAKTNPRTFVLSGTGLATMEKRVLREFLNRLAGYSITDAIHELMVDPNTQDKLVGRTREALSACKPAWQPEPTLLEIRFADSLSICLPEGNAPGKRQAVAKFLMEIAESIPQPTSYTMSVSNITTLDPHRCAFLRRTLGGRPHYLDSVKECYAEYQHRKASGNGTVDVFNRKTIAKMPSLMPNELIDSVDLSLALGLAIGGVALRGGTYFWNLDRSIADDNNRYHCSLKSHWNGLAYKSGELKLHTELSRVLLDTGRLTYGIGESPTLSMKLGNSLDEAFSTLKQKGDWAQMFQDFFEDLKSIRGNKAVRAMIMEYIDTLPDRFSPNQADYRNNQRHLEILTRQAEILG